MADSEKKRLLDEIRRLKEELDLKSKDLEVYKSEVSSLNEQIVKLIQNIEKQVEAASKIHGLLVPTELPEIQGFEFSSKYIASGISGGDYFDIFRLKNKSRFGILMASSSGHAVAALFLSVLIRLTAQIIGQTKSTADEILSLLKKELEAAIEGEDSASVLMGVVDRRDLSMEISSKGEIYTWYQNKAGDETRALDTITSPITSENKEKPASVPLSLNGGERLVFLSHGLIHLTNAAGEEFGAPRVVSLLKEFRTSGPHELRNELLFQAKKFVDGAEFSRDLSIIVMDVKDRVIKLAPKS